MQPSFSQAVNKGQLTSTLSSGEGTQLSFRCEHFADIPRTCSLTFLINAGTDSLLYFDIERTYIRGGFEDRARIFDGGKNTVTGSASLSVGSQMLASGGIVSGLGRNEQMRSNDFIQAIEYGKEVIMLVQADGRVQMYRLPYLRELAECVKAGNVEADDSFDRMASDHGGRAVCRYYSHLGRVVISSRTEYTQLLNTEIAYLKDKLK